MMVIENRFKIGDFVYLKTDPEHQKRIVTGITIREGLIYYLALGEMETTHYEVEISDE